jgi:hypothetical protein
MGGKLEPRERGVGRSRMNASNRRLMIQICPDAVAGALESRIGISLASRGVVPDRFERTVSAIAKVMGRLARTTLHGAIEPGRQRAACRSTVHRVFPNRDALSVQR